MTASSVISIILIIVLLIISVILFVVGYYNKSILEQCESTENPHCFTLTCPNSDGRPVEKTTATCHQYAYRCVDDKHVMCSFASGVIKEIDPADVGIIDCSGNNIPCTDSS